MSILLSMALAFFVVGSVWMWVMTIVTWRMTDGNPPVRRLLTVLSVAFSVAWMGMATDTALRLAGKEGIIGPYLQSMFASL